MEPRPRKQMHLLQRSPGPTPQLSAKKDGARKKMEQEAKNPHTLVGCPSVYRSRSRAIRSRSAFRRALIIACRRRGSYCLPTKRRIVHLAPHADAATPSPHPPQRRIHGGGRAPLSRISEERLAPHQAYLISSCTERVLFFSPVLVS